MSLKQLYISLLFSIGLISCDDLNKSANDNFSIENNTLNKIIYNNDTLELDIKNHKNKIIDSVIYKMNNKIIPDFLILKDVTLGEKIIKATIFSEDNKQVLINKITVLNSKTPKIYSYEVVNIYDHDITSYTQGIEFDGDILYESTGQYGESKLRALDYKNNKVLKNIDLSSSYFGEGLTILNNKIYQLTWKEGRGLIYDLNKFKYIDSFNYGQSNEGWGLCNDGVNLYKTDGSENIWILNSKSQSEEGFIQAYTNKGKLTNLNELEWVEGKIYANRYQKNGVAIINPENGAIEAVIDFKGLKKYVTKHNGLDVLNGIAYNKKRKTIFVTGKRWDKLFEVRIITTN
jgi:glutamine cyclotransferase